MFASRKAVEDRCREVRDCYEPEMPVTDPVHHGFLCDLIETHCERDEKVGPGIRCFEVCVTTYGTRGLRILRVDGTRIDFSWKACLGKVFTPAEDFNAAARHAVMDQVLAFKKSCFDAGTVSCAVTGRPVSWQDSHVDHEHPMTFSAIVETFMGAHDWKGMTVKDGGNAASCVFSDPAHTKLFADFHRDRARLRILSPEANMALGNRRGPSSSS